MSDSTIKNAFVDGFIDACAEQGLAPAQVPEVVKQACATRQAVREAFEDFLIKPAEAGGSLSAAPSSPATPSPASLEGVQGLGEDPAIRRFMGGLVGMRNDPKMRKKQQHPCDIKNSLAVAQAAQNRRFEQSKQADFPIGNLKRPVDVTKGIPQLQKAAPPPDVTQMIHHGPRPVNPAPPMANLP